MYNICNLKTSPLSVRLDASEKKAKEKKTNGVSLVTPKSKAVSSFVAILLPFCLVGCRLQVKVCSRETHSPSQISKTFRHNVFQITHLHTTVINSGCATQLTTAHTVGLRCGASLSADCGYNILADAVINTPSPK